MGPLLWNCALDTLLESLTGENFEVFACADDVAVFIEAQNRDTFQSSLNNILARASSWAADNKLEFATNKCNYIIFRGKHSRRGMVW